MNIKNITRDQFIEACKNNLSMAKAASALGLHFNTFKKYALEYNCYKPNQAGRGIKKDIKLRIHKIEDYATRASVRKRIIKENLLPYECNECGIKEWKGKALSLHLDHINGMNGDNRIENLRFLCPNCHSLTETYTGKNK
jgi:5-methylcytosine-specific restriction endonuclease McrA